MKALAAVVVVLILGAGSASAHAYQYTNGSASVQVKVCGVVIVGSINGICMLSSDLASSSGGQVRIFIYDQINRDVGGYSCFDRNQDNACDDDVGGFFCNEVVLDNSLVLQVPFVVIYFKGPVLGNAQSDACGALRGGFATTGYVDHFPV